MDNNNKPTEPTPIQSGPIIPPADTPTPPVQPVGPTPQAPVSPTPPTPQATPEPLPQTPLPASTPIIMPEHSSGGHLGMVLLAVVLLIIIAAGGGYYYMTMQTTPAPEVTPQVQVVLPSNTPIPSPTKTEEEELNDVIIENSEDALAPVQEDLKGL